MSFGIFLVLFLAVPAQAGERFSPQAKSLAAYTMGIVYDLYGQPEAAIDEFEKAVSFADHYLIHLRLGADYARAGRLEDAIREEQAVLAADAENVQARYLLALIYSTQKDFDAAARQYESILTSFAKAEPENMAVYGYLGQLYYAQKEYPKAIKQFEMMLTIDPQDPDVLFLLGSLYLETGDRGKATEMFSRAVQLNPEDALCLNSLGYLYAEQGVKLEEAQKLIEQALELDPENGAYLDSLGWVYYQKGEYDTALKYLQEADANLKDPTIYEHLGDVYFKLHRADEARHYWELSLELSPEQDQIRQKIDGLK